MFKLDHSTSAKFNIFFLSSFACNFEMDSKSGVTHPFHPAIPTVGPDNAYKQQFVSFKSVQYEKYIPADNV